MVHIITTVTIEYKTVKHGVVVSGVRLPGSDEVLDAYRRGTVWASPEAVNDIRCVASILQRDASEATPFPISDHYSSTVFRYSSRFTVRSRYLCIYILALRTLISIIWRDRHEINNLGEADRRTNQHFPTGRHHSHSSTCSTVTTSECTTPKLLGRSSSWFTNFNCYATG